MVQETPCCRKSCRVPIFKLLSKNLTFLAEQPQLKLNQTLTNNNPYLVGEVECSGSTSLEIRKRKTSKSDKVVM
jgi:hypothetical protein